jgi:aminoglycoside phosphotransferase (APT) family kinase protein
MLTRPDQLSDAALAQALGAGWGITPATMEYRAVGYGSHHWEVTAGRDLRWFVTVDDLPARLRSSADTLDAAYGRLCSALRTARAIYEAGALFVVAPVRTADGDVVRRIGATPTTPTTPTTPAIPTIPTTPTTPTTPAPAAPAAPPGSEPYAIAVYPYVDGRARQFGDTWSAADRRALLTLIAAVHAAPADACRGALADDFLLPGGGALSHALDDLTIRWDGGPYGEPARQLLAAHGAELRRLLERRDRLAAQARRQPERMVPTHGEPHPGNFIQVGSQWTLVDWDTLLIAPPERDLWLLDPGDGSIADAYRQATGRAVVAAMLDLYRLTWELSDLASSVTRFRQGHADTAEDRKEWEILSRSRLCSPS